MSTTTKPRRGPKLKDPKEKKIILRCSVKAKHKKEVEERLRSIEMEFGSWNS
jgi:hypothetical protein